MGIATKLTADPVALSDAALIRARVQTAGSSFYWAMRFLPQGRRDALFAIYAFCREVDDIADGDAAQADKIAALDAWRRKIETIYAGRADDAITRSLSTAVAAYGLRKNDFLAVVQGMEMDARGPIVAPPWRELDLYCDCVASAVGRLCVPAFGEATPAGDQVAAHLGRALQLTNILRDVEEDAGLGRLYLPAEALDAANVPHDPQQAFAHPRLPEAMAAVGARAQTAFTEAETALASCAKAAMRPAVIMMMVYRRHLDRLRENGWRPLPPRTGLARARANIEKLWIAIHYGLL